MIVLFLMIDYYYYRTDGFVGESYALEAAKRMNLPGNDDDDGDDDTDYDYYDDYDDEEEEEDEDDCDEDDDSGENDCVGNYHDRDLTSLFVVVMMWMYISECYQQ